MDIIWLMGFINQLIPGGATLQNAPKVWPCMKIISVESWKKRLRHQHCGNWHVAIPKSHLGCCIFMRIFKGRTAVPEFYLLLDSKRMFLYCAVSPFLLLRKQSTSEVGRSLYFQMPRVAQPRLKPLRRALVDERFRIVTLTCPYSYTSIQWETLSRYTCKFHQISINGG